MTARIKPGLYAADAAAPPPPDLAAAPAPALPAPAEPARRRLPWARVLGWSLAGLAALWLGLATWDWIAAAFGRSAVLGSVAVLLLAAALGAAAALASHEWRQLAALDDVTALRARVRACAESDTPGDALAALGLVLHRMPGDARARDFTASVDDTLADRQCVALFERLVMEPLDRRAEAIVVRAARDAAVGVSISPVAALDAAIVLWRSLRMVREIAQVYGFRPGTAATLVLAKRVLATAATNVAIDFAGTLWGEHLGGRVAGMVSAKLAEGIVTAVRTARLGLATIAACRPLPAAPGQASLARLRAQVFAGLAGTG